MTKSLEYDTICNKKEGGREKMISLDLLAFEVTRRCNELCKMCMRGEAENIDMTEGIVNQVLLDNYIQNISTICFSGGEPTLNEKLVCYTIEFIIKNKIPVQCLSMVTNAKYYPIEILEAFNDYQRYCQLNHYFNQYKNNIIIDFSTDLFHENCHDTIQKYQENFPQFEYRFKNIDRMWATGKATQGERFWYKILPIYIRLDMGFIQVINNIYVTAKGCYETLGDGAYKDMDKINMGVVYEKSLLDIIEKHGKICTGDTEKFKKMIYTMRN